VLDMKLRDVWLAAMAKNPKGAGRPVGEAIVEIEAALVPEPTEKSAPPAPSEASSRSEPKAQPTSKSDPGPKSAPVAEAQAKPSPGGGDLAKQRADLLDTKLSDIWLAAMAKDPSGTGHSVGDAITAIEVALVPPATGDASPRTEPKDEPAQKPEPTPKAPSDQTPLAAE